MRFSRFLSCSKKAIQSQLPAETTATTTTTTTNGVILPAATEIINPQAAAEAPNEVLRPKIDVHILRFHKELKVKRVYHKKHKILMLNEVDFTPSRTIGDAIKGYKNIYAATFYKPGTNQVNTSGSHYRSRVFPAENIISNASLLQLARSRRIHDPDGVNLMFDRVVYYQPKGEGDICLFFRLYREMIAKYGRLHLLDKDGSPHEALDLHGLAESYGLNYHQYVRIPWGKGKAQQFKSILSFCYPGEEEKPRSDDDEEEDEDEEDY